MIHMLFVGVYVKNTHLNAYDSGGSVWLKDLEY